MSFIYQFIYISSYTFYTNFIILFSYTYISATLQTAMTNFVVIQNFQKKNIMKRQVLGAYLIDFFLLYIRLYIKRCQPFSLSPCLQCLSAYLQPWFSSPSRDSWARIQLRFSINMWRIFKAFPLHQRSFHFQMGLIEFVSQIFASWPRRLSGSPRVVDKFLAAIVDPLQWFIDANICTSDIFFCLESL